MSGQRRIGILGGTFNPPHHGHLLLAEAAVESLALDRVVLVPTGIPPHKPVPDDPGPRVRLELTELAVAGDPRMSVSDIEVRRDGPSFTVDTLREFAESEPGAELVLILGGDMALSFAGWREPEEIVRLARIAVVERGNIGRSAIAGALMRFGPSSVKVFTMPRVDLSSTDVRERVAAGLPTAHRVVPAVAQAVAERGLYRPVAPQAALR